GRMLRPYVPNDTCGSIYAAAICNLQSDRLAGVGAGRLVALLVPMLRAAPRARVAPGVAIVAVAAPPVVTARSAAHAAGPRASGEEAEEQRAEQKRPEEEEREEQEARPTPREQHQ